MKALSGEGAYEGLCWCPAEGAVSGHWLCGAQRDSGKGMGLETVMTGKVYAPRLQSKRCFWDNPSSWSGRNDLELAGPPLSSHHSGG